MMIVCTAQAQTTVRASPEVPLLESLILLTFVLCGSGQV